LPNRIPDSQAIEFIDCVPPSSSNPLRRPLTFICSPEDGPERRNDIVTLSDMSNISNTGGRNVASTLGKWVALGHFGLDTGGVRL
jgi:hypothetical protein